MPFKALIDYALWARIFVCFFYRKVQRRAVVNREKAVAYTGRVSAEDASIECDDNGNGYCLKSAGIKNAMACQNNTPAIHLDGSGVYKMRAAGIQRTTNAVCANSEE